MALPTQTTVNNFDTPNKSGYFYPNDGIIDQLLHTLIFQAMPMSTEKYEFCKADSIPATVFFNRDAVLANNATNVTTVSDTFQRVGDHLAMDNLNQIGSRGTDQLEQQVRGIQLGILRQLSTQLIMGAASPNILGFNQQVTAGHGVNITPSVPFSLQSLYTGIFSCKPTDNSIGVGGGYLVGNESALRQVLYLLDQAGRSVEWRYDNNLGVNVAIIAGLPWLIDNSIPVNAGTPDTTSIYVVKLDGETGIRVLYAKDPNANCNAWGIHLYEIPLQADKDNRYMAVVGFYALHVPEDKCIVRINEIQLANIL